MERTVRCRSGNTSTDILRPTGIWYNPNVSFTNYTPGTHFAYSSAGIALIGYVIECFEGVPTFVDYCWNQLFEPLGMERSSFLLSDIIDTQHLALPYKWNGASFDIPSTGHPHTPWYPGGILRTSALEMARFLMAIMNGGELDGERIVAAATIDTMLTDHFDDVPTPRLERGLAWYRDDLDGRLVWGHGGQRGCACAASYFSREENNGAVMLANSGGAEDDNLMDGKHFICDALLDFAARTIPVAVPEEDSDTPSVVRLDPCYPNPFNPRTQITFSLPRQEWAEVGVFDQPVAR